MNFLERKQGNNLGVVKAPKFDPFNRYSNNGSGFFGFKKDRHTIIPGVTPYEEMRLKKVKDYVEKKTGKECTLSQELINDIYSMYVNDEVKRRPKGKNNSVRHKVLDKVYNSLTKVVTKDSPLFTQMLTRELSLALQKIDDSVREQQKQNGQNETGIEDSGENEGDSQEGEGDGNGDSKNDNNSDGDPNQNQDSNSNGSSKQSGGNINEDIIDKTLEKNKSKIQKAMDNASDKIKDMEDQLGKEATKDLAESDPDFLDKIDKLKNTLKNVSINKENVKKILEKILNESQNYFSTKFKRVEESLFDCEECEDLFGLEFLHPIFKNSQLMDVGNEHRIYKGKIDLYLDCSGSMGSSEKFEGEYIKMLDLVKGIAMVLFRMGMIENLYFFDNNLYQIKNINEITILSFYRSGGTNFERVISKIKENGNNSVIITDGEDYCSTYDKRVFWIGVGGTRFQGSSYGENAFKAYRENRQCVTYNSNSSKFDYCKKN